jgi:UPF0755 protein
MPRISRRRSGSPLRTLVLAFLLLVALVAAWGYLFSTRPVTLPRTPYEFTVRPGSSLKAISRQLAADGVFLEGESFWILGRVLGKAASIQAGTYRLDAPMTPVDLLDKLARGDVVLAEVLFVEGTTLRQWLAQLARNPQVKQTLAGKDEPELRALFGTGEQPLEGWFFPDTYRFTPGAADVEILKRAHAAMKRRLNEAWSARDPAIPLRAPYEALILASIVGRRPGRPPSVRPSPRCS